MRPNIRLIVSSFTYCLIICFFFFCFVLFFWFFREELVDQLKNVQERYFQEVEELKSTLLSERSSKKELAEELDLREKRLLETNMEIEALAVLKTGLEGSLQTSNARALDDKARYERELSVSEEKGERLKGELKMLEKALDEKNGRLHAVEIEKDQIREAYEQMLAEVRNELGKLAFRCLL